MQWCQSVFRIGGTEDQGPKSSRRDRVLEEGFLAPPHPASHLFTSWRVWGAM